MTKLHTLKDIMPINMTDREKFTEILLKQEAIKDIKEIRENYNKPEQLISYIMWKNNITEEDLK